MFDKTYVRVESLAIDRALQLRNGAGFSDLYMAKSGLWTEEGYALAESFHGRELFDAEGNLVKVEELKPEDLGLGGEIEEFTKPAFDTFDGPFLERTYHFYFNDPKTHKQALWVTVVYAKDAQKSDWSLRVESVYTIDLKGNIAHASQASIYRDYREAVAKK